MNSVFPNIQFTVEREEDFPNRRLPTLDCELWLEESEEGNFIRYSFFEKVMKNPYCIMQSSAMSSKSKIQILSQDLIRRLQNICDTVTQKEKNNIIDNYYERLRRSGYSHSVAHEIIVSGLVGYERKVVRAAKGNSPLHRAAAATLQTRIYKKLTQRENWYKIRNNENKNGGMKVQKKESNGGKSKKIPLVSVMFVPYTPNSQLLKKLKQAESKVTAITGDKVKHVERAGTKLRHLLISSDPWSNVKCNKLKCLVCSNPFNENYPCRKRNITYKTYCLKCAEAAGADTKTIKINVNNQIKFYFGESFRDAITRGNEHLCDYIGEAEDSHMFKHICDEHHGSTPREIKFGMSVVKQHKTSFSRMVFESVLIYRGGQNIFNSKSEFSRCQVPRLSVMVGDNQKYDKFEKNVEVLKLKRRLCDKETSKSKRRRKVEDDFDSTGSCNAGLANSSPSEDPKVLFNSNDISVALDSHNKTKKEKTDPVPKFPPITKHKISTKKSKPNQNLKGQQTISFYFQNTQRAHQTNFGNSCSPHKPPT